MANLYSKLKANIPYEIAQQLEKRPRWLRHEGVMVTVLTVLSVLLMLKFLDIDRYFGLPTSSFRIPSTIAGFSSYLWILWGLLVAVSFRILIMATGPLQTDLQSSADSAQTTLDGWTTFLVKWIAVIRRSLPWTVVYGLPWLIAGMCFDLLLPATGPRISLPIVVGVCFIVVFIGLNTLLCAALGIATRGWLRIRVLAILATTLVRLLPIIIFCVLFTMNPPTRPRGTFGRDAFPFFLVFRGVVGTEDWHILATFADTGIQAAIDLISGPEWNGVFDLRSFQDLIFDILIAASLYLGFIVLAVLANWILLVRNPRLRPRLANK